MTTIGCFLIVDLTVLKVNKINNYKNLEKSTSIKSSILNLKNDNIDDVDLNGDLMMDNS